MCGIAGFLDLDWQRPVERRVIESMCESQVHRGPDASDQFVDGSLAMGFQRLAIIDLDGGRQPMRNEDDTVVLVCNGEIFNAPELRTELEHKGHRFRSRCDVEVLLHLYEEQGVDFVKRLNGQFAAAIYDRRLRRLILVRDPFGICPLHYAVVGRTLIFASEIKAILRHPAIVPRVDLTGLDQVFTFPGLISPTTMFEGIRSLQSGHRLIVEDGAIRDEEYWDLIYPRESDSLPVRSEAEYVETLSELLNASVRRRLQADVPVGVYLSGGLDSSLIAALAKNASPTARRHAFSISFPGHDMDESNHQALVAQHVGAEHRTIPFDWPEIMEKLTTMVWHAECPLKESYNSCSLALSAAARRAGVPVILSGEGADELFAGYIGYRFDRFKANDNRNGDADEMLEADFRERLWGNRDIIYETNHLAHRAVKAELYSDAVKARYDEFDCLERLPIDRSRLAGLHPVHRRSYLDFKLRLVDHLVSDHGDRMAMANSVEARFPFLDPDIVAFATQVPPELKLNGWQEKYLVKRVAAGRLPEQIVGREKFGFHAPGSPYLLHHSREWMEDMLSPARIARQGYFNTDTIEALKRAYTKEGFRLNLPFETDLLFIVLTFNIFLEAFSLPDLN